MRASLRRFLSLVFSSALSLSLLGALGACTESRPGEVGVLECPEGAVEVTRHADGGDEGLERWCRGPDGSAQGPYQREAADGQVIMRGTFVDGLASGAWEWLDGEVTVSLTFVSGRAHGRHVGFEGSELRFERFWELASPCGLWSTDEDGDGAFLVRDFGPCDDGLPPPEPRPLGWAPLEVEVGWTGCEGRRLDVEGDTVESLCEVEVDGLWVREGPYRRYWDAEREQVREVGAYRAGLAHGSWYELGPGGEVLSRTAWKDGVRDGEHVAWFLSGAPRTRQVFVAGLAEGLEEGFAESGPRAYEVRWKRGLRDGSATVFGVRGLPLVRTTWVEGVETGSREHFFEDGALRASGEVVDGRRQGVWETWYTNGQRAEAATFVDDVEHGLIERYEPNGDPSFRAIAVDGSLEGEASVWMREGVSGERVRESGLYVANERHGLWNGIYEDNGARWRELHYLNGVAWGTLRTWWPNGQRQLEVELVWEVYQGVMSTWWDDGTPQSSCFWEDGVRHGPCTRYWEGGVKKAEGEYRGGLKAPGWLYWDREGNPLTTPPDGEHEGL